MTRCRKEARDRRLFDLSSGVHDHDTVRQFRDDAEIMGYQDDRHSGLGLKFSNEVQDLRLDRDVQRGGGLVRDQHRRLAGQGGGDHDALAKPAGELVRVPARPASGIRDPHLFQEFHRPAPGGARAKAEMAATDFRDLLPDLHDGVECRHRFLEDHADSATANIPKPLRRKREKVRSLEHRSAGGDLRRGVGLKPEQ